MEDKKGLFSYLSNISFEPVDSGVLLRDKKEIVDKLLIDYTLASIATYAFCSQYELIKTLLSTLDKKYDISSLMEGKDKELIVSIYNKKLTKENLEEITYRFESANLCMWLLSLTDEIYYNKKCSVKKINELILNTETYKELTDKSTLRNIKELFDYYNTIARYVYSNSELDFLSAKIISLQDAAIKYAVLYNFNKDGLKVIFNKDDLKFEFILKENVLFDKVGNNTRELFALSGITNDIKIVVNEIKEYTIQDDLKRYMNLGFNIISIDYVKSEKLDNRLLKVVISKDSLILNTYYLDIKDHLIRYTSKNTIINIDEDIIFSIKAL